MLLPFHSLAETEPHEGKRKTESLWPIFRWVFVVTMFTWITDKSFIEILLFVGSLTVVWKKLLLIILVCFILLSNPGSIIRSLAMFMTYFTEEKQSAEVYIIFSFLFNFFHPFAFVSFCCVTQKLLLYIYIGTCCLRFGHLLKSQRETFELMRP